MLYYRCKLIKQPDKLMRVYGALQNQLRWKFTGLDKTGLMKVD